MWSGNIFLDIPVISISRSAFWEIKEEGMLTKHHRVWRLTSRVKTTQNNLYVTTQLLISQREAWVQELFFSHNRISSSEPRQLSIPQSPSVLVVCSSWLFSIVERWFLFDVKDAHWLGLDSRQSARSNIWIWYRRTGAVAVAGPLGQLEFQSILKAKPLYVIG